MHLKNAQNFKTNVSRLEKMFVDSKVFHVQDLGSFWKVFLCLGARSSLWSMKFVFKVLNNLLRACHAVASSLPWDLPRQMHCDHMHIVYIINEGVGRKISGNMVSHHVKIENAHNLGYRVILIWLACNFFVSCCNARACLLVLI